MLPQLRELEERFADVLVVVGVHSAKYPTERLSAHLRAAIQRLGVHHPVLNDADFAVWQAYAVRAWPTLMFIDPFGKVIGKHEGEASDGVLVPAIEQMIAEFDAQGALNRDLLAGIPPPESPGTELAFPGGVHADAAGNRLVIADTNHHRLVIATLDGRIQQVIGSGVPGLVDGVFATAQFQHPHGIVLHQDQVYVADTGNHALRCVDLMHGTVTTVAGTGTLATTFSSGGTARETALRSPWDVAVADGTLLVTMAGSHQVWSMSRAEDTIRRTVGSGHEGLRDGPLGSAWLAQPSGMAVGNAGQLLFTDSEASALRIADFRAGRDAGVRTLVGEGLFEFGDVDGAAASGRLQHPLGIAWHAPSSSIFVADTYNNKIKRFDLRSQRIETWAGAIQAGHVDGIGETARFFEPEALSISNDVLYIADTNNHRIRRADLTQAMVTTLDVRR